MVDNSSNYRPIALSRDISKTVEKAIQVRIESFLINKAILKVWC